MLVALTIKGWPDALRIMNVPDQNINGDYLTMTKHKMLSYTEGGSGLIGGFNSALMYTQALVAESCRFKRTGDVVFLSCSERGTYFGRNPVHIYQLVSEEDKDLLETIERLKKQIDKLDAIRVDLRDKLETIKDRVEEGEGTGVVIRSLIQSGLRDSELVECDCGDECCDDGCEDD